MTGDARAWKSPANATTVSYRCPCVSSADYPAVGRQTRCAARAGGVAARTTIAGVWLPGVLRSRGSGLGTRGSERGLGARSSVKHPGAESTRPEPRTPSPDRSVTRRSGHPLRIQLGPAVLHEQAACVRARRFAEVDIGGENRVLHRRGACDDPPVGRADEGFSGERQAVFSAHAVAQCDEVAVLKGRHLHLSLVETFRPLTEGTGLRHDDQVRSAKRERTHVFGIVTVVADRDADVACLRPVDGGTLIAGRVVTLFVKAWIVGDVD